MSKYYKVDDVSRAIFELPNAENGYSGSYDKAEILNVLESLPTIEVSDKADRPFEYFEGYEDGRKSVEVSEDCVSRKWLEENAKEFGDYYENTVWAVPLSVLTDAPSVVPKTQIETQNSNENSNEDAISREWLISFIDAGHLRNPNELCYSERGVVELIKHAPSVVPKPKEDKWIIHKINGIPHTVECSHCHQHYDYEELRHLGRSKGCIDIPHCPNCGAHLKGAEE